MLAFTRVAFKRIAPLLRQGVRRYSELPDPNKPVKFTTSEAARWQAVLTRQGMDNYSDTPEAQTYIVSISLAVLLYYFFYFREESDIDEQFDIFRPVYDKVDDLEEVQLKVYRQHKVIRNEDVREIDERLLVLEQIRLNKEREAAAQAPAAN